jgi:predicted Zn-ribbon and HTH transcriptional regulator
MARPALELADIFRRHGPAYRRRHALALPHYRVMRAIERCRTAALGGHKEECGRCGHQRISYNSCRNRHCPKCQSMARARWLEARKRQLLPVEYFHVVFTLPDCIAALAYQNPRLVYSLLFASASKTLLTIAADEKQLGAKIGFFAILHTWGQNLLYHPHLHCVATGGGIAADGRRWISTRPGFFLPVRVLSRLFRRLMLEALEDAFEKGRLKFYSELERLAGGNAFTKYLAEARQCEWVVYAKPPMGGPQQVIEYLGRYTHRVAIANPRLVSMDEEEVRFRWKDYRHHDKVKVMTLEAEEFIRRFLLHTLPAGFQRIRHYGLLANSKREESLARARKLLATAVSELLPEMSHSAYELYERLTAVRWSRCPRCGAEAMVTVEVLAAVRGWDTS